MAYSKLEQFDRALAAEKAAKREAAAEAAAKIALKRAVRAAIPKALRVPRRSRGRPPVGGLTRKEVAALRRQAGGYLDGEAGLAGLEVAVQHTALVILLIDGVLGTEPWRASGPHGGIIAANARLRYLENATRILDDIRRRSGADRPKLLDGVIEAERG
jgi:hypothetical protein